MEPTSQPQPVMGMPAPHAKKPIKKSALIKLTIVLAVVAAVVAGWMAWNAMNDKAQEETPTASVTITHDAYAPATIKISKGQDITWTNNDDAPRQIVGDQGSPAGFKSDEALNKGDSYSFTFEDAGTYYYHDAANINMKGVIVVE